MKVIPFLLASLLFGAGLSQASEKSAGTIQQNKTAKKKVSNPSQEKKKETSSAPNTTEAVSHSAASPARNNAFGAGCSINETSEENCKSTK